MLSVIIPMKNMEKYITKCIESVVKSKNIQLEIIVVDFGSDDSSITIVKELNQKYKNITLYTKKAKDVCEARNVGIEKAKYEYITFLDADDWVGENFYSRILHDMKLQHTQLGFSDYKNIDEESDNILNETNFSKTNISKIHKNIIPLIVNNKFNCESWNKIYVKKIIKDNNIKFDGTKGVNGEDLLFNIIYISNDIKISYTNGCFYYHLKRKNSLGSIKKNLTERFMYISELLYNSCDYVKKDVHLLFVTLMMQELKGQNNIDDYMNCYHKYSEFYQFKLNILKNVFSRYTSMKRKLAMLMFLLNKPQIVFKIGNSHV